VGGLQVFDQGPATSKIRHWGLAKGNVIGTGVEHEHGNWPKEGLRLMRYEAFADF
jgi:hypothetical protein